MDAAADIGAGIVFLIIAVFISSVPALGAYLFMRYKRTYDKSETPATARRVVWHVFWLAFLACALFAAAIACSYLPGRGAFIGVGGVLVLGMVVEGTVVSRSMLKLEMSYNKRMTPALARQTTWMTTTFMVVIALAVLTVFAITTDFGTKP